MKEYLANKYALWFDFRTIDENALHGTGKRIENLSEGITLQIEKKAESAEYLMLTYTSSWMLNLTFKTERLFLLYIRKMLMMLEPHTALFVAPTGVGKTHLALDLLKREYFNHFDFIVIICTTLRYNSTYKSRNWFWTDSEVIQIEPDNPLYGWIEKILAGSKNLFQIDNIIAGETLDKQRNSLLDLALSGRQKGHSLWLLTQSYTDCCFPKH